MKTKKNYFNITLGVFLLTTAIVFANNNDPILTNKKNYTAEVVLNKEYVTTVHENSSQNDAKFLSGVISEWDVLSSAEFDSNKSKFKVVFKSNKGFADVIYDREGQIIKVKKYFKNVRVPVEVHQVVSEKFGDDWVIVKNKYNVSYKLGDDVVKSYVLTLQNGSEKKKIKVQV